MNAKHRQTLYAQGLTGDQVDEALNAIFLSELEQSEQELAILLGTDEHPTNAQNRPYDADAVNYYVNKNKMNDIGE